MTWIDKAACRRMDPAMFDVTGQVLTADNQLALTVCRTACPVITACRWDAVDHGDTGIRGAEVMTDEKIRRYRRERARELVGAA